MNRSDISVADTVTRGDIERTLKSGDGELYVLMDSETAGGVADGRRVGTCGHRWRFIRAFEICFSLQPQHPLPSITFALPPFSMPTIHEILSLVSVRRKII